MNRELWYRLIERESFPGLPCPRCINGKLKLVKDGLKVSEPRYSKEHINHPDWEPDHTIVRWIATLRCDEKPCGEIVHMMGDTDWVEVEEELPGGHNMYAIQELLRIQAVFPAPPLFRISENVPYKVKEQLDLSFRMYWTDVSACVARIRTSVEALLDHQKVPKERMTKKKKLRRMNLKERIDAFTAEADHQDQLQGLRNIGNLGTHGTDDVVDTDLYDAIDVLEHVLTGIYDTQTIKAKAKKLADKKSKT